MGKVLPESFILASDLLDVSFEVLVFLLEVGDILLEESKLLLGLDFVLLPDLLNLYDLSLEFFVLLSQHF